jgi:uncharacterized protein YuzE
MKLEHDREADAIYIRLREGTYAYGEDLDPERRIDYDAQGEPIGIEILNVSGGINLDDLPENEGVAELLAAHPEIPVFA